MGSGSQSLRLIMCALYPLSPGACVTSLLVSSPLPLVPRVPADPEFVPQGVGVGRTVCWVPRAQVHTIGRPGLRFHKKYRSVRNA